METIKTEHAELGTITWHVVGKDDSGNLFLMAYIIGLKKAFYDPTKHKEQRFLRTDYSGKQVSLMEIEPQQSSIAGKNIDSQRWKEISQYGSNQWVVSDLREYLNTDLISGLPENFRNSILPQTNTVILAKTHYDGEERKGTTSQMFISSEGINVYDTFDNDNIRRTYAVVTDHIFLPTVTTLRHGLFISPYVQIPPSGYICWSMEPYIVASNMPYLVNVFAVAYDTKNDPKVYITNCNAAYPLSVCPMCVIRSPERERK